MNYGNVQYEASYGTASQLPLSDLPEIAFSGRSNVGKSSLINKFFGRKNLAKVSSVPGKTTTVNFFKVDNIRFADLPGYGYAKRSDTEKKRWAELMESYFRTGRNIKLVVQLLDMRHPPSQDDITMLNFIKAENYPFIIVLTKCDKLNKSQRQQRRTEIAQELSFAGEFNVVEFSALTGEGCEDVRKAVEKYL